MSLNENISQDLCNKCQKEKELDKLISSCVLISQELINLSNSKIEDFDIYNFINNTFMIILVILTYISASILPGVIIMGTLFDGHLFDLGQDAILFLILAVVVGCFYIGSFWSYYVTQKLYNKNNKYFLLTVFITSLVINIFILLCHFIVFILLLVNYTKYNYSSYYTSYSFYVVFAFWAGFAFWVVITIPSLFILFIFFSCQNLYKSTSTSTSSS